ncbi:MAG: hypothetical protein NC432_02610 [Roseburia sp.]|nr:hypothetical protein [Roseburia sp.]MCM1097147.1 hypothetical protein [Ruminococcus flavefaciens]
MTKARNACMEQEIPDDLKQWLERFRQPFNRMLKDIYDDLFQKEFQKGLTEEDDVLCYGDPDQGARCRVHNLVHEILSAGKYYGGLVGPRGGLDSRNRGKGRKDLAILLLEWGYLLQENMDGEAAEPLEQALERFLENHPSGDADPKDVIHQLMQAFADVMRKNRMMHSELLQNTDRMLLQGYLKPAYERLQDDLARADGSVNACAEELLPVISAKVSGKTAEELQELSRDAAVLKVLLQNLLYEYFHSAVEGSENGRCEA